jgi:hypothetical protein
MGILSQLTSGKKIKFYMTDVDTFEYDSENSRLLQIINNTTTGHYLSVVDLNEDTITINWGSNVKTYYEVDIIITD